MKKVLLCSPYYKDKEQTTCGIANWTRNILNGGFEGGDVDVTLLPFDRSVDLFDESNRFIRIYSGIKDYLGLVLKTRRELRRNHYDIVQISSSASLGLIRDKLIAQYARRVGTKVIVHYHFGRIPMLLKGEGKESKRMKKVLKLSDASVVMDQQSFKALNEHGYSNVYYVPNPLSDKWLSQIDSIKECYSRNNNTILFVGHVVQNKGIYELVKACDQVPDVKLKIVGRAEESTRKMLLELVKNRTSEDWIQFTGEVPHADVLKEMCQCALYALPSYTEGFPNVILESMACACPTIATSVGAIPEMMDVEGDNPCGVLVKTKDINDLEKAIKSLLEDEERRLLLGENGYKRVRECYTVAIVRETFRQIWLKL